MSPSTISFTLRVFLPRRDLWRTCFWNSGHLVALAEDWYPSYISTLFYFYSYLFTQENVLMSVSGGTRPVTLIAACDPYNKFILRNSPHPSTVPYVFTSTGSNPFWSIVEEDERRFDWISLAFDWIRVTCLLACTLSSRRWSCSLPLLVHAAGLHSLFDWAIIKLLMSAVELWHPPFTVRLRIGHRSMFSCPGNFVNSQRIFSHLPFLNLEIRNLEIRAMN